MYSDRPGPREERAEQGSAQAVASEELMRLLLESIKDYAICTLDLAGRVTSWNDGARRLMGYTAEEIVGQSLHRFYLPEDLAAGKPDRELQTALAAGRSEDESWRVRKDGSRFWANEIVTPLHAGDGTPLGFAKISRDLSERKNAEAALRRSEERMRSALAIETVGVIFFDLNYTITDANQAFQSMSGYSREEFEQGWVRWDVMTPPEFMPASRRALQELLTSGQSTPYEKQYIRKDGSRWWGLFAAKRLDENEIVEFILDISAAKRTEAALRASEERLRLIMDSINDHAIFTQDEEGRIIDWNSGAEQVFGYTADEVIGQLNAVVFTPEDREKGVPAQEMQQARSTGRAVDERWHIRKDGSRFWASGVLTPLQESTRSGYVKVARDLTERRQMEQRLEALVGERTAQVRELVTQLTMTEQEERRRVSSILHDDLQQRLFSLLFQLASLRQAIGGAQTAAAQQLVNEMEAALRASVQITRELSVDLSPPVLHDEGLVAAVRWLAAQMEQQQGLAVEVTAGRFIPLLNEDLRVLLFQTVRELLFNVVKHAGVNAAGVALSWGGELLRIEVSDEGRGFAVAENERGSTSQGLRRIGQRMQLLGGGMKITSAPGQGTHITLYVPLQGREGKQA